MSGDLPRKSVFSNGFNVNDLISLINRQESTISELVTELRFCKESFSDTRAVADDFNVEVSATLSELKENVISLSENADIVSKIRSTDDPLTVTSNLLGFSQTCSGCRQSAEKIALLNSEIQRSKSESKLNVKDALDKVQNAVDISDTFRSQNEKLRAENFQLKTYLDTTRAELEQLRSDHVNQISGTWTKARDQFSSELTQLQDQVQNITTSEAAARVETADWKQRYNALNEDLQTNIKSLHSQLEQTQKDLLSTKQELFETSSKSFDNDRLLKELRLEKSSIESSRSRRITDLEQQLRQLNADKSHLVDSLGNERKERIELLDRSQSAERDLNLSRTRLERLEQELGSVTQQYNAEISNISFASTAQNEKTRSQLESLLSSQNVLIHRLREECRTLNARLDKLSNRNSARRKR